MTPPLLPFPIFREVSYTDGSSIKMLAGRSGNKLGVVAFPPAMNGRQTRTPSRSTEAVIMCQEIGFDSDTPELSTQSYC